MDVSGLGGLNNPLRLNPNQINAPDVLPSKLPPALDDKSTQKSPPQPQQPGLTDTPSKPVINKNLQSFQNLLTEIGVPNTPQNSQLAQTLANYGQPINKNTMNQVANSLGPIMQQGAGNIEAGVVLLINNIPVTAKAVESVKQMLTGGGLSQNLLSLNKDLQKLVNNVKDKDFVKSLESKIQVKEGNGDNLEAQNNLSSNNTIKDSEVKPMMQSPLLQNSDKRINESGQVKKNPFEEEFQEENNLNEFNQNNKQLTQKGSSKSQNNINQTQENQGFSLLDFDDSSGNNTIIKNNNLINNNNPQNIVNNLINKAEKLNATLTNIINADILKNPANFPQQINMLKKQFADLEIDIEEIKEILESSFSDLKEDAIKTEDESIFTNLLKMFFEDNPKIAKKNKALNTSGFESDLLKNLTDISKAVAGNISGRELLANNQQCLCIPLSIPFNNKIYEAEIMITREDNSNKKAEIGDVPLKINLSIQTHNMGKVGVDMSNLKKDLQVHLNVDNINIKNEVDQKINSLQSKLDTLPFEVKPVTCSVNPKHDESNSLLLPKKYQVMSMRRIEGIA